MRSLLLSLIAGLVLSLALVFAAQLSVVHYAVEEIMEHYMAAAFAEDADEIATAIVQVPGGETGLALSHFDPPFLRPHSGRYYEILVDQKLAMRSPSLVGETFPLAPLARGEHRVQHVPGPRGQVLLSSAKGYELHGRVITIAVAGDLKPIHAQVRSLMARYTRISLFMFALLVLLQAVISRVTLAPLKRAQEDVGRLERGEITQLRERVPREVLPLVREVNRLLALLTRRLERSRESLGNLAHAIKAPLTVLTHMAEDVRREGNSALGGQIMEQLGLVRDRVDAELRRARIAGGRITAGPVDVGPEIESLAGTLRKLYRERRLEITSRIEPGVRFAGDREDLLELAGNLLDNACKWARSRVLVSARGANGFTLVVEDDGPGCPQEDFERIAQRGVRLDEAAEGHGLGLSIARSIVASYGADMRFGRSQALGGFEARVSFPAA